MERNMISKSKSESLVIDDFSSQLPVIGKYINEFALYHLQENVSLDKSYKMSDTFAIIVVYKGDFTIKIDGRPHSLSRGAIACIPPGKTLNLYLKDQEIDGYMMTFSPLFFELLQIPVSVSKDKLMINSELDPIENTLNRIDQIFSLIKDGLSNSDDLFRKEKLLNLVAVFYIEILNAYAQSNPIAKKLCKSDGLNWKNKICKDFFVLVKQYSREERQLKFYADKLCVSPKHLSFLIKNATGLPANKWITDAVIHDAKHLLQNSGNSVKEIAYILNFSNQSFFGKYFKREVGISPSDYQSEVLC